MNCRKILMWVGRFRDEEQGSAATEYAVCLALIVLASIVAVAALGVTISELLPDLADYVSII